MTELTFAEWVIRSRRFYGKRNATDSYRGLQAEYRFSKSPPVISEYQHLQDHIYFSTRNLDLTNGCPAIWEAYLRDSAGRSWHDTIINKRDAQK